MDPLREKIIKILRDNQQGQLAELWEPIISNMVSISMVGTQPITSPIAKLAYLSGTRILLDLVEAETRRLKSLIDQPTLIAQELDREIISTILHNAPVTNATDLVKGLKLARDRISNSTQNRQTPNWFIGNTNALKELSIINESRDGLISAGKYSDWDVFVDSVFPVDEVLIGYHGPGLDCGTIWTPYTIDTEIDTNGTKHAKIRHKITIVDTRLYRKIKLQKPG